MESNFYMDHARKGYITSCPNLVTESQKYTKSRDFWEKELLCKEHCYVLLKNLERKHEKDLIT